MLEEKDHRGTRQQGGVHLSQCTAGGATHSETSHAALRRRNIRVTQPYYLKTLLAANDAIVTVLQPRPCLDFGMKGVAEQKAEGG